MKPSEVLDCSLDEFQAYIEGYSEHLFDMHLNAIQTGFWSAYFSSKKPKSLKQVLEETVSRHNRHDKSTKHNQQSKKATEVDVEGYLAMERNFLAKLR